MSTSIFHATGRKKLAEKGNFLQLHVGVKRRDLVASLALGIGKPNLFTTLNVMGGIALLLDVTMDTSQDKFISGSSDHTHHAKFPAIKRVTYHGRCPV